MNIFLTGSEGFIGGHLWKKLKELGHEVKGFDLKSGERFSLDGFNFFETQDIRQYYKVEQSMKKFNPDIVIHLAALAGVRESLKNPQDYYETNVIGTHNVLQASKECKVKKVLVASSSSVYGDQQNPLNEMMRCDKPLSPYAVSKIGAEMVCQYFERWLPISIFRPFTVFGKNGREEMVVAKLIKAAKEKTEFTMYGDGSSSRGYTYVGDLIDGIIKLMKYLPNGCEIFNLGGAEEIKLSELVEIVKGELGEFPIKQEDYHFADVKHNLADVSKAKDLLGWKPTRKFRDEIVKLCHK